MLLSWDLQQKFNSKGLFSINQAMVHKTVDKKEFFHKLFKGPLH